MFVKPFLLACGTRNPKFAGNAIACLQRLIVANALPQETLGDVLGALRECSTLALDIQLKILQALPSLLQNYAGILTGPLLISASQVCFLLYNNKTAVVTNLAAAALQQLISSVFERAAVNKLTEDGYTSEVAIGNDMVEIYGAQLDAYQILGDVCLLTEGQKPEYIQGASIAQNFGLELIESVIANHIETLAGRPEEIHLLRSRLMPFLIKILSEKGSFSLTVRAMRLVQLILSRLLIPLASECEMTLSLLNHMLDPDAAPPWKRAMCLEIFRTLHVDPALIRCMYSHFDDAEEKRNIIRDHLGSLVRLASEKPAVIGLGQQSSTPSGPSDDSGEQAALQAGGLVGSIGASVTTIDLNTPGISTRWSTVKTPFIEQLDKSEPSALPITYIYSLALTCLTSFEDGLARFLLPFTVPMDRKTKRRPVKTDLTGENPILKEIARPPEGELAKAQSRKPPVNPLTLKDHPRYDDITTSAHMIDQCWPALLAASSTFFNASMDSDNFHGLIRSFQKFTQISGLLGFSTPRDAFLTTLGKHALPSSRVTKAAPTPTMSSHNVFITEEGVDSSRDGSPAPSTSSTIGRQSIEQDRPIVNSRHLLCLRALLNLAIALSPVLHTSWTIILEVLQQANLLISNLMSSRQRSRQKSDTTPVLGNDDDDVEGLGQEITAVETATLRLFESTAELTNEAFLDHLQCLCSLLEPGDIVSQEKKAQNNTLSPSSGSRGHQKLRSISGMSAETSAANHETAFVLGKLKLVVRCNVWRLTQPDPSRSGWDMILKTLMGSISSEDVAANIRFEAAVALNDMLVLVAISDEIHSPSQVKANRARSLKALLCEVDVLYQASERQSRSSQQCELEIHRSALDSLRALLEHCGESLIEGWTEAFEIILTTFDKDQKSSPMSVADAQPRSLPVVRSAFGSLELICSDFLSSVPRSNLLQLQDTLYHFSAQTYDLNISLTTATYFRTTADYLLKSTEVIGLDQLSTDDLDTSTTGLASRNMDDPSSPLLWLSLLIQLNKLSKDPRVEARHSTLHTTFRILDAHNDRLSQASLRNLYHIVIEPMLQVNQDEYTKILATEKEGNARDVASDWNKTAVVLVEGVTKMCSQWLDTFKTGEMLSSLLSDLLENLQKYLGRKILIVSKAIFGGISKMLAEIEDKSIYDLPAVVKVWELWGVYNPVNHKSQDGRIEDNNDAILAHLYCLGQLLRLSGRTLKPGDVRMVIEQLLVSVQSANASAYSTDVDSMTAVQKAVLEGSKMLPTINKECDILVLNLVSKLVQMAYAPRHQSQSPHASYVALSKASMTLLESLIENYLRNDRIVGSSVLPSIALSAVYEPLSLKYKWRRTGREPSPWRQATTVAMAILQMCVPIVDKSSRDGINFWKIAVKVVDGIIGANCEACDKKENIPQDEAFDIDIFSTIRGLFIPALDAQELPQDLRDQFSRSLFQNSLIHEPHPDDLARPGEDLLQGLNRDHFGRVKDLPPSPRSKMSYLLFDQLFDLVSVHEESREQKALAKAAYPYMILRVGLTLKTYINDQPLRGRMPLPSSQKNEMLYVLRKIVALNLEPEACTAPAGAGGGHKEHLIQLYPLILKALKAAWRDETMTNALREVLENVGYGFK